MAFTTKKTEAKKAAADVEVTVERPRFARRMAPGGGDVAENGYPVCPVPDEINANHNGGADIGPLYYADAMQNQEYPYACEACWGVLGLTYGTGVIYPATGDGKADFC